mmetsp:Transcript_112711/g.283423  ORF Transcript_112711/g.283423 Transcript_112711/m.283423 type:complete len:956 (-) Transcript_112711:89-2956(-)
MGCGGCSKHVDVVAPPHKPYRVPPGQPEVVKPVRADKLAASGRIPGECTVPQKPSLAPSGSSSPPPDQDAVSASRSSSKQQAADHGSELPTTQQEHEVDQFSSVPRSLPDIILEEGSELQGLRLPPWNDTDEDVVRNFGFGRPLMNGKDVFTDPHGFLELSERQREALHAWRRMPEIIRASEGKLEPMVLQSKPSSRTICQGLVGDCSLISALSALAEYENKFREPVLSGIIHPKSSSSSSNGCILGSELGPAYNEYGQYGCRLFLNGTTRKVVVDDTVPVRRDGKLLCAHSACPQELWVTLLEKSLVKIMGSSFDMQGSNPGTDVFHLTGWVPETIPLTSDCDVAHGGGSLGSDATNSGGRSISWDEVFSEAAEGFHAGWCVVCVGTSELADAAPDAEARRLGHIEGVSVSTGLVSRHAYPVLDCRQLGRHRLLRLKNPWGRVRWRGRFSPGDPAWMEALPGPVSNGCPAGKRRLVEALGGSDPTAEAEVDDGHFWIEWEDVLRYFSHLYLCWAPRALGLHQVDVHGRWDPDPHFSCASLPDDTHLTAFNPQYLLRLKEPLVAGHDRNASIWVLLSRHVRVRTEISSKYVATHIYRGRSRLCCPDAPLEQGIYSNGECALVKLHAEAAPGEQEFVLTVSQHAQKSPFNFTLQVYTTMPATLAALPPLVPPDFASGSVRGNWTAGTAGGCSNNLWRFFQNPQWRFEVPAGGVETMIIFLECPTEHSVNVRLFSGTVARPEALRSAKSSGAYRQGCCFLRLVDLAAGPYIAVVSTFRPGLVGGYRLAWHASKQVQLHPQPHPFALPLEPPLESLARKVERGSLLRFQVDVAASTLASFRVQSMGKNSQPPKLGLFQCINMIGEDPGVSEQVAKSELQKETFAESYFAASGGAVILLAEIRPSRTYILQVFVPKEGRTDEADLYITSNGCVNLGDGNPAFATEVGAPPAGAVVVGGS